jgi:hypothetical protein
MRITPPGEIERAFVQHYSQVRSRLRTVPASIRVNSPMPEPEVRSEPEPEKIAAEPLPCANDNDAPVPRPTVAFVVAHVARYYGLSSNEIMSQRRHMDAAWPRHIAVYIAKQLTLNSWAEIGRRIGGRDHSTALNSYSRVSEALAASPGPLTSDMSEITERIAARLSPSEVQKMAGKPFWAANRIPAPERKTYPRVRDVTRDFWTLAKIERLNLLWDAGLSQDEIAAAFGTTKGAVSGKINRLGIVRRPRQQRANH